MTFLPDDTIRHLRGVTDLPDLAGTRYAIVEQVARGGMGVVYRAHDRELRRDVALKVLNTAAKDGDIAARLTQEAQIIARLEHPGIVPVHDVGVLPDGRVYYTMKLIDGKRLDEYVRDGTDGTALDVSDVLRIFVRICEAVAFAHSRDVIHRDLKPANIMIGSFGEVLVLDWGVAKTLDTAPVVPHAPPGESTVAEENDVDTRADTVAVLTPGQTSPGTVMGTPGYMAPEQERGDIGSIDRRTDVYALGAILRELVGHLLPEGFPSAPKRLRAIVAQAVQAKPADRYQTAETMARDVTRYSAGLSVNAYQEGVLDRLGRAARRHRVPIALILAYLLMRVLLFIFTRL